MEDATIVVSDVNNSREQTATTNAEDKTLKVKKWNTKLQSQGRKKILAKFKKFTREQREGCLSMMELFKSASRNVIDEFQRQTNDNNPDNLRAFSFGANLFKEEDLTILSQYHKETELEQKIAEYDKKIKEEQVNRQMEREEMEKLLQKNKEDHEKEMAELRKLILQVSHQQKNNTE